MPGTKRKYDKHIKVTVDGLEVTVLGNALTDMRTVYLMGKISDDSVDDGQKLRWYMLLLDTVFEEEVFDIMEALAKLQGGHVDAESFAGFFARVLEAVEAKN